MKKEEKSLHMDHRLGTSHIILGPHLNLLPHSLLLVECFPHHYKEMLPIHQSAKVPLLSQHLTIDSTRIIVSIVDSLNGTKV